MTLNNKTADIPRNRVLLKQIFVSPNETRLRAGWRILLHLLLMAVLAGLFTLVFDGISSLLAGMGWPSSELEETNSVTNLVLDGLWIICIVSTATWIARRYFDRRSFRSLGFQATRHATLDLIVGFLLAGTAMASLYFIESAAGWLNFQGLSVSSDLSGKLAVQLVGALFLFTCAGYAEELIVRGYEIQNLREGTNLQIAVILSSTIFSLSHLSEHITIIALAGFFLGGLVYAYAWWRTGNLWLPIGMHIGWNFVQSAVLGYPVGGEPFPHLINQSVSGPAWITGGTFGPEGGVIRWLGTLLLFGLIWLYLRSRSRTDFEIGPQFQRDTAQK